MKLRTKTGIFYTLLGATVVFSGAGLGLLLGLGRAHEVNINMIQNDKTKYKKEHIGLVSGSIVTSIGAICLIVSLEFGLSYYLTLKFVKAKKEKMKKTAMANIIGPSAEANNYPKQVNVIDPSNNNKSYTKPFENE